MGRILVKDGKVVAGLPGFQYPKSHRRGNGTTHCYHCGLPLTDELSFVRGVGPSCFKEYGGLADREWVEEYAKEFKAYQARQKRLSKPIEKFGAWLDGRKDESVINLHR